VLGRCLVAAIQRLGQLVVFSNSVRCLACGFRGVVGGSLCGQFRSASRALVRASCEAASGTRGTPGSAASGVAGSFARRASGRSARGLLGRDGRGLIRDGFPSRDIVASLIVANLAAGSGQAKL
jgi:hypothetical protein